MKKLLTLLAAALLMTGCGGGSQPQTVELHVSAAASLTNAMNDLAELYAKDNPNVKIEYAELSASGPPHMPTFEYAVKIDDKIFGEGSGNSKKLAEQMAAKDALEHSIKRRNKSAIVQ